MHTKKCFFLLVEIKECSSPSKSGVEARHEESIRIVIVSVAHVKSEY